MRFYQLQKKYLDYQVSIGKKFEKALHESKGNDNPSDSLGIVEKKNLFLKIVDDLFSATGKSIDRNKNEITILSGKDELTPYQLSSGEKQLLVILLSVLVQDGKQSIFFMDEPEISLHFDWQKKLIGFINEINPNIQIILATHSPALIMESWLDRVTEVSDIVVKDRAI